MTSPVETRALLALSALIVGGCLPTVESVKERRENFPRSGLTGSILLEATPPDMQPVGAVFGGRAKLLGTTLDPARPTPGRQVTVTFYWTAVGPMEEEYQVFLHGDAVGEKQSRIHGDHFPAGGRYPTDVWREGDVIRDEFTIFIPPGYGGKHLGLFTGLYKGDHRVPLTDGGVRPQTGDNRSRAVDIYF